MGCVGLGVCYTIYNMLKIRLQRIGRRNNPSYRVVVVDSQAAARKGKPVELLGTHDTIRKTTSLNNERILHWIGRGAQVSDTMHNILIKNGVIEGIKRNVLPKKSPVAKESEEGDGEQKGEQKEQSEQSEPNAEQGTEQKDTATAEEQPADSDAADATPSAEGEAANDAPPAETPEEPKEEAEAPKEEKADDAPNTEEEKPPSPPPQDTPSAEG